MNHGFEHVTSDIYGAVASSTCVVLYSMELLESQCHLYTTRYLQRQRNFEKAQCIHPSDVLKGFRFLYRFIK